MVQPWKMVNSPDKMDVVSPEGTVRCTVDGYYDGRNIIIDDMSVDVRPGDELRRMLPNGNEEAFLVTDPKFFNGGHFGKHYQVEVKRPHVHNKHTGGNYSLNLTFTGNNARANFHSTDNSSNVAAGGNVISSLREALHKGLADDSERQKILVELAKIETAHDAHTFNGAYQSFIAAAANHMTIIAPFLPAVAQLITNFGS